MYTVAGKSPENHGKYGFTQGLKGSTLHLNLLKAIFCGKTSWSLSSSWFLLYIELCTEGKTVDSGCGQWAPLSFFPSALF